jgi:o-succinylbenzoate---CoA ligase
MAELTVAGQRQLCPVRQHSLQTPDQIAIRAPRQVLTYADLDGLLSQVQQQLAAAGLRRGDHLASIGANSLALILLAWGCLRAGLVFCPLNPRQPRAQLYAQLQQLDAKACWLAPEWHVDPGAAAADGLPDRAWPCPIPSLEWGLNPADLDEETAVDAETPAAAWLDTRRLSNLILTSGSSGTPKAVAHTVAAHWASATGSASAIALHPGDGWLLSLPLFHVGGYAIPWRCFLAGATLVLPDPDCSLSEHLLGGAITHLSLVPTQLYRLLQTPGFSLGQTRLRHLLLGGAPIPQALVAACQAQGLTPQVSYGLSEMATQVCTRYADGHSAAVGTPLPGRELKLVADEICVRGATLFSGYYRAGALEPTLDDEGWFHTGDRGGFNGEGELLVVGRRDNRFISGGENIQPETIEQALLQHPDVQQAIVVPLADAEWGMTPVAFIDWQPEPSVTDGSGRQRALTDLAPWLRQRLAPYLIPRHWLPWPQQAHQGLKPSRQQLAEQARHQLAGD